jgi:hypothetical protein
VTTRRLAVVLAFTWAIAAAGVLLLRPTPELTAHDHIDIYATVIRDMHGPGALLDPKVLEPVEERLESDKAWPRYHGQALLDDLRSNQVVRGICEPAEVQGRPGCRGGLPGPVLAVSTVRHTGPHSVQVSILLYTVPTLRDKIYLPFAVEYEYQLEQQGVSWAVTTKKQTMIT